MDQVPALDPVGEELAIAITKARTGAGAGRMASELQKRDCHTVCLVGLRNDAERAVYCELSRHCLNTVPFDETGVEGGDAKEVEWNDIGRGIEWNDIGRGIELFVRDHADLFCWIHPRFRWVTEYYGADSEHSASA